MQQASTFRRGSLAWPIILIALGVVFLLNNLGILSWSIWDLLWRLWPLLLVIIGLDLLLGRRSAFGAIIVAVIVIALIAGVIWYAATVSPRITGQTLTTNQITQDLSGAARADVTIAFGAGSLRIGALKDSPNLIEGTVATVPGETVTRDFRVDGNVARFELRNRGVPNIVFGRHVGEATWNLDLSSVTPIALRVESGVGESTLDLTNLKLTDVSVNSGVGQMQLRLPGRGQVNAHISGGIGQVTVIIPEGMPARIHGSAGLGNLTVPPRFQRQGDYYVSPNYSSAEDRIDLNISGGIGQVVIQ